MMKYANFTILPLYIMLTSGQFLTELAFNRSISQANTEFIESIVPYIIMINIVKFILTTLLSITSLRFACQLGNILKALSQEEGFVADRNLCKLQMTYWFVIRLAICFLVGDIFCNLIKPVIYVTLADGTHQPLDPYTWAKTWSVCVQIVYLIEVNLQQLLILFFYYRLNEQQDTRKLHRNSMQTASQYDFSERSQS